MALNIKSLTISKEFTSIENWENIKKSQSSIACYLHKYLFHYMRRFFSKQKVLKESSLLFCCEERNFQLLACRRHTNKRELTARTKKKKMFEKFCPRPKWKYFQSALSVSHEVFLFFSSTTHATIFWKILLCIRIKLFDFSVISSFVLYKLFFFWSSSLDA